MAIKKIKVGSTTHDIDAHVALNTNLDNLGGSASAGPVFMVKDVSNGEAFVDYRSMPLNIDWGGTGGATKLEAANSLDFWSLTEGTDIAANTNLNNLTTPGNYKCANEANCKTLVNGPSDVTNYGYLFTMKVGCLPENSSYMYQEIVTFGHNIHYYRRKPGSSSEWQPWSKNFNSHNVVPLENGGTGSGTAIAEAPKNAIIRKINETNGTSLTYTATNKGAFYASAENGVPTFGTLPATIGGTGNDISAYPDGVLLCKQTSSSGSPYVDYYSKPLGITVGGTGMTSNPSMLTNLSSTTAGSVFASAPRPGVTGTLGLSNGGTGISTLADAPNNAIIRKGADVNYLYYTATKKGAFYANSENGTPTFGVLPATIGGTGNDISDYPDGCFLVKQTASDGSSFIDYYSNPLGISVGGTGASTASKARSNLGFSYATSAPTSTPSTGAGAVCFVVDSGTALPISEGGTGASTKVNAVKNLGMYPVGSVYITNTSTSPASYLGGTWECFDKELKGRVWDSTSTSGFWTYNSTNTESDSQVYAYVEGHKIHMRFDIHTKVEMGESAYNLGTLDYETMGFGSFPYSAIYAAATSDGGNAVGYCRLDYSSGVLQMVDVNPKTDGNTLPAGAWLYLILEMPITTAAMYDRAVDRFHWKRTA